MSRVLKVLQDFQPFGPRHSGPIFSHLLRHYQNLSTVCQKGKEERQWNSKEVRPKRTYWPLLQANLRPEIAIPTLPAPPEKRVMNRFPLSFSKQRKTRRNMPNFFLISSGGERLRSRQVIRQDRWEIRPPI